MKNKKIIASLTAMALIHGSALANVSYTAEKGDSYWKISQKFNTTLNSVLNANGATTNTPISIGQIISVPSNTYTVQKGDTYYLIAKKCGVTLSALLIANGATNNTVLYAGQKLTIPDTDKDHNTYTVQKGDTYWIISQKYGVSLNSLLTINNANENTVLYVGDVVKIPSSDQSDSGGKPSDSASVTYIILPELP